MHILDVYALYTAVHVFFVFVSRCFISSPYTFTWIAWFPYVNFFIIKFSHCILISSLLVFRSCLGGKKRSTFYYDIWNIKYLSKFKWDDLTEEIGTYLLVVIWFLGLHNSKFTSYLSWEDACSLQECHQGAETCFGNICCQERARFLPL